MKPSLTNNENPDASSGEDPLYELTEIRTDPRQSPIRIDKFLMDRLYQVSRSKIQQAITEGLVTVDGKLIKSNFKLKPGMLISVKTRRAPKDEEWVVPQEMDLDIRYEDDHVMVIYKPPGLVVHPGIGIKSGTLVNGLAYYFQGKEMPVAEGNSPDRPGLVHRIDKDTSGLMVIAKTEPAMTHLAKQFFDHTIERKYLALIWGEPEGESGTINLNIGRDPRSRIKHTAFPDGDQGKVAVTHWKMLEPMYYVSLVQCELETGRTHQIRVHFSSLGHPLFSDEKYDGDKIRKGTVFTKYKQFVHNCFKIMPRQALHASIIGFTHPDTGERMRFEAPLPEDFLGVLEKWRNYVSSRKK
ncbi:MAG: RluA family pseudouridine synthase [Saprospiraceae bacterium]|nr:RluA family pseudouridine synthase [Saprospiraceae bacterium]